MCILGAHSPATKPPTAPVQELFPQECAGHVLCGAPVV